MSASPGCPASSPTLKMRMSAPPQLRLDPRQFSPGRLFGFPTLRPIRGYRSRSQGQDRPVSPESSTRARIPTRVPLVPHRPGRESKALQRHFALWYDPSGQDGEPHQDDQEKDTARQHQRRRTVCGGTRSLGCVLHGECSSGDRQDETVSRANRRRAAGRARRAGAGSWRSRSCTTHSAGQGTRRPTRQEMSRAGEEVLRPLWDRQISLGALPLRGHGRERPLDGDQVADHLDSLNRPLVGVRPPRDLGAATPRTPSTQG